MSRKTKTYRVTIEITHDVDKYNASVEAFLANMHPALRAMRDAPPNSEDYPLNGSICSVLTLITNASGCGGLESDGVPFEVPLLAPGAKFELPPMHELAGVKASVEEIES